MKGDREKCIEAGAWDYLSKPVDTEQLLGCAAGLAASLSEHAMRLRPLPTGRQGQHPGRRRPARETLSSSRRSSRSSTRTSCSSRSGAEALREVLEREFAVILLDVNMPDIDGLETAELIRQHERSAHTPIIFVTAYADEMQTARGYSLGAVDYILTPVVPEILRSKVRVFVELYRAQRARRDRSRAREAGRAAGRGAHAALRSSSRSRAASSARRSTSSEHGAAARAAGADASAAARCCRSTRAAAVACSYRQDRAARALARGLRRCCRPRRAARR